MSQVDRQRDRLLQLGDPVAQVDATADGIRAMLPASASSRLTLDALRYHLYRTSAWNRDRRFSYDLNGLFGEKAHNKLLTAYILSRNANGASMPLLLIVLGKWTMC